MRRVILKRDPSELSGTFGVITAGMFSAYSLELPWKENRAMVSCIPFGEYDCSIIESPKFGKVYTVKDVPGRTHVLIHKGNFAGDTERGLKSDVEGCILIGNAIGEIGGQRALLASRDAFTRFMEEMGGEPFRLIITVA